ncbi:F510_1955 family glycosylhydrolase [Brevibacillus invocatus]|uniref:F510_1955 family glycosylhydrolase n=1 Tax=Brevibacillus invocatus TaxID=173959 RepID=UPI0039F0AA0F
MKAQEDREKRVKLSVTAKYLKWSVATSILLVSIIGVITLMSGDSEESMDLMHAHGLGYSPDGKEMIIPAHDGLRIYEDGSWMAAEGPKHDYMGFAPSSDGFYSSGHPAPGSALKNPLGIVKSTDGGKTIQTLVLDGQTDFHLLAVGYSSHVIYAMNPQANSIMDEPGLYFSTDDAKTWTKSQSNGIREEPISLAVHPSKDAIVALGTPTGVYLSKDNGNHFEKVVTNGQATALLFNEEGDLFMGGYQNNANLQKMNVENRKAEKLPIPTLTEDAIAYIAQNPSNKNELSFVTFKKDVYISDNQGLDWKRIAEQGKVITDGE